MHNPKPIFALFLTAVLILILPSAGMSENVKLRVTVERANIRLKPSLESAVVGRAPLGTIFENAEKVGDWFKISLPPDESGFVVTGYIHSSIVDVLTQAKTEAKKTAKPAQAVKRDAPSAVVKTPPPSSKRETRSAAPPSAEAGRYKKPRSSGRGIGLKLSGGLNYMLLGDINDAYEGKNARIQDQAMAGSASGEFPTMHMGMDFSGEIVLYFSRSIGIGIGGGYIKIKSSSGDVSWDEFLIVPLNYKQAQDLKISAIPIRLTLHFTVPMGAVNLAFRLGGDYYLGKFSQVYKWEEWFSTGELEASGIMNTLGGHAGLGFEINISRHLAFVLDVEGRYAKFKGIEADWEASGVNWMGPFSDSGTRTLYYYDADGNYPTLLWDESIPAASTVVQNPREGAVDLSGIFFGGGFRIRF
ncbi:MAG: SH3 domain-containing protein [Candidatus Aminicenantes bacterium]|nr:SH3 domain-containing protein [Candidatus Aminicenantes bacterium]